MNVVIGLCHFCEAHGPRVVLRTEAEVDNTDDDATEEDIDLSTSGCPACEPAGRPRAFASDSGHSTVRYVSQRPPYSSEKNGPLHRACMRSLSCEVGPSKDSSFVFFGDSVGGRVLSYAFQLKDTRARGLQRWFSILALSRDKTFLANVAPYLSERMKETAEELFKLTEIVYAKDQAVCSQRALRLKNNKTCTEAPRSLIELTEKDQIFAYLHTKFTGMLCACTRIFSESVSVGLSRLQNRPNVDNKSLQDVGDVPINTIKSFLGRLNFVSAIFCILVGIQVIVRGDSKMCRDIVDMLQFFSPKPDDCSEYTEYAPPSEARIFHCKSDVAVPRPCSGIFRIDVVEDKPIVHWSGELPTKLPNILKNIMKAIDSELIDSILILHITAQKEEFLNNLMALKCTMNVPNSQEHFSKIKKSLGYKCEDDSVIRYWISNV